MLRLEDKNVVAYGNLMDGRAWFAVEYKDYSYEYFVTAGPTPAYSLGVLDAAQVEEVESGLHHRDMLKELLQ